MLDEMENTIDALDPQGLGVQGLMVVRTKGQAVIDAGGTVVSPGLHVM